MNRYLLNGIWTEVVLVCPIHESVEMIPENKKFPLFYACTHKQRKRCSNKISVEIFNEMISYISDVLSKEDANNDVVNLKHHCFKIGDKYEFKILVHESEKIIVQYSEIV